LRFTVQASSCILVEQIVQGLMNQMVPFKFWWYSDDSSPFLSYKSITSGSTSAANPQDYSFTVYCLINACGFPLNLRLQLLDISAGMAWKTWLSLTCSRPMVSPEMLQVKVMQVLFNNPRILNRSLEEHLIPKYTSNKRIVPREHVHSLW
jgi:hypothetical protein